MRVIEDSSKPNKSFTEGGHFLGTSIDSISQRYGGGIGISNHNNSVNTSGAFSYSFRVVTTTSPNCISVSQIDIKGSKLNKTPLAQFIIDEGKIAGFDIHPSRDYLLVTSTQGRVYVFRIDTGELRGTIQVP